MNKVNPNRVLQSRREMLGFALLAPTYELTQFSGLSACFYCAGRLN